MGYERTNSLQNENSRTPQSTTQFGSRPFPPPVQMKPQEQQTPEELENEAFNQNKFEAFGLQLKEKSGTITPVEQEQLSLLQAKMDDFWAQRQEKASRSGFDFSKVSVTSPGEPAAPEIQPMSRLETPGMPLGRHRSLSNSPLQSSASPLQRKLTIGEPGDKYEQEADQVASQVVEQINSPKAAQSTQGQSLQRQEEPVEELQAKPSISELQRSPLSSEVQRAPLPLTAPSHQINPRRTDGAPVAVQEHTVSRAVQRKGLSSGDILTALSSIPFVNKKLDEKQRLRRDERDNAATVQTMREHVNEVLTQYEGNLRKSNDKTAGQAISIAVVLEAVARIIAVNELNDPGLTPELTMKLMELYRTEIENKFPNMDERGDVLNLAKALTVDDPISLYMHNEMRLEDAAIRVGLMAKSANKPPEEFFNLLRQRFEIELASYNKTAVQSREDTGNTARSFNVKDATGEVSRAYLERMFPNETAQWQQLPGKTRKELEFTTDAANMLERLENAVVNPASVTAEKEYVSDTRSWNRSGEYAGDLTKKQSTHLAETEEHDKSIDRGSLDDQVSTALQSMFSLNPADAAKLIGQIKNGLGTLPITLTVKGASWFGGKKKLFKSTSKPTSTIYKPGSSRGNTTDYSTLFDKPDAEGSIRHLGEFEDTTGQERGKNYGRFRNWKDQKMTGNQGFSDAELPSFAAVNINWSAHSSQRHTRLDREMEHYGENSYGDTHFVLRKNNIIDRLVYTATDHGKPRRDIYLAFCDFLLGTDAAQSQTGHKPTQRNNVVKQVINALITKQLLSTGVQCFEVQIFGELDISKDVEKIAVAPSVDEKVLKNIQKFCGKKGMGFEAIQKPTEEVENEAWFKGISNNSAGSMQSELQTELDKLP